MKVRTESGVEEAEGTNRMEMGCEKEKIKEKNDMRREKWRIRSCNFTVVFL